MEREEMMTHLLRVLHDDDILASDAARAAIDLIEELEKKVEELQENVERYRFYAGVIL